MIEQAMTVRQVAEYLNVDAKVIYRLVQAGELPGFKVARSWRFKRDDIDSWIEQQKKQSTTESQRTDRQYAQVSGTALQGTE